MPVDRREWALWQRPCSVFTGGISSSITITRGARTLSASQARRRLFGRIGAVYRRLVGLVLHSYHFTRVNSYYATVHWIGKCDLGTWGSLLERIGGLSQSGWTLQPKWPRRNTSKQYCPMFSFARFALIILISTPTLWQHLSHLLGRNSDKRKTRIVKSIRIKVLQQLAKTMLLFCNSWRTWCRIWQTSSGMMTSTLNKFHYWLFLFVPSVSTQWMCSMYLYDTFGM